MIKLGHIWRRKGKPAVASHFNPALTRVREMREHSAWPPATDPDTIHQRAERVKEAREHVLIKPHSDAPACIRLPNAARRRAWIGELFLPLVGALITVSVIAVVWVLLPEGWEADHQPMRASIQTVFAVDGYTNLTDSVADKFARQAFQTSGYDLDYWTVLRLGYAPDLYLQRLSQNEGMIFFQRGDAMISVNIKLDPGGKQIICTINHRAAAPTTINN